MNMSAGEAFPEFEWRFNQAHYALDLVRSRGQPTAQAESLIKSATFNTTLKPTVFIHLAKILSDTMELQHSETASTL